MFSHYRLPASPAYYMGQPYFPSPDYYPGGAYGSRVGDTHLDPAVRRDLSDEPMPTWIVPAVIGLLAGMLLGRSVL